MTTSPLVSLAALGRGASSDGARRLRVVPAAPFRIGFSAQAIAAYDIKDTKILAKLCKEHGVALPKPGTYSLPRPITVPLVPGTSGIGTRNRGQSEEQAMSEFVALMAKQKKVIVDPREPIGDFLPDGGAKPDLGYLRDYACVDPSNGMTEATHYASVFDVPFGTDDGEEWRHDREAEGLWIMSLQIRKLIPNVAPATLRLRQTLAEERVAETAATAYPTDQGARNAETRREQRLREVSAPAYRPERVQAAA